MNVGQIWDKTGLVKDERVRFKPGPKLDAKLRRRAKHAQITRHRVALEVLTFGGFRAWDRLYHYTSKRKVSL